MVITAIFTLTGCEKEAEPADVTTFHVISDGVTVEESVENPGYADFYIPEGMVTAYESRNLTPEQMKIFEQTRDDLGHFRTNVILPIDTVTYTKILDLIRFEELSFFPLMDRYIGDYDAASGAYTVNFKYYSDNENAGETMTRMNMEIEAAAKKIMSAVTDDMDDYEKLKYFHDYLITNCETDASDSGDIFSATIYGTLIKKKALCEGYAKTFSYLCNLAGIENCLVSGVVTLPHMWNMVKLDDNWYHVDVTYDVPDENILFQHPDFISYQYFLVSDNVMKNDRTFDEVLFTPPPAKTETLSYFYKEGRIIDDPGKAEEVITAALVETINEHKGYLTIKCSSTDVYLQVDDKISKAGGFDEINSAVMEKTGILASYSFSDYYAGYRILTFFIQYSS
jgi:hypothetical protein